MIGISSPNILDYLDEDGEDIDLLAYDDAEKEFLVKKRQLKKPEMSSKKPYLQRKRYFRRNPRDSIWYIDYVIDVNRTWRDPLHRDGKTFSNRFSHSFDSVCEIVEKIQEPEHNFWKASRDATGRESSPIHLLVLGSLRMLTRNVTLDDLSEDTFISTTVHSAFFKKFMRWYAETVFPEVVRMPTLAELKENGQEYDLAGFPGSGFSVDCVHVRVWGVSANLKQISTGKEKFPSRVFEAVVNHRGTILAATRGFYGSVNDKSIVKFDGAMVALRNGCYAENTYDIYDADGNVLTVAGCYAICDNGYHKWPTMMEPTKRPRDDDDYNWSEMNESLRKDVECLFGILKQEFAILKYGCRFSSLSLVDDIFQTCCAMHNQRKVISGSDQPWDTFILPPDIDGDMTRSRPDVFRRMEENERFEEEGGGIGSGEHEIIHDDFVLPHLSDSHATVKNRLITHFKVASSKNEVFWPRRNGVTRMYTLASSR